MRTLFEFINYLESEFTFDDHLPIDTITLNGEDYSLTDELHVKRNELGFTLDITTETNFTPETYKYSFETIEELYRSEDFHHYIHDLESNDYTGVRPEPEDITHQDVINDWDGFLNEIQNELPELNYYKIKCEILECELWHANNNSLNEQRGV